MSTTTTALTTLPVDLPDRFFIDLAIGAQTFEEICRIYDLDPAQVEPHTDDPRFMQRLAQAEQSVADDGRAFRARCRRVVHDAIPRMHSLIHNPDVPAATQLSAFQTLVKFSGMEPEKQAAQAGSGTTLTLNIIAPDGSRAFTVGSNEVEDAEIVDEDEFTPLASAEESSLFAL